jgi:hypothetical protein
VVSVVPLPPAAESAAARIAMLEGHLICLPIARSFQAAYAFLADPWNYAQWAAIEPDSFRHIDQLVWEAETHFGGTRRILFCRCNPFGVLDHAVYLPGTEPVMMPIRLIPNGDGCLYTFRFFRRPGVTEMEFRSAIEWVQTDLMVMKQVVETHG